MDAGTACFVDAETVANCMPDEATWFEGLFDTGEDSPWFNRMDDPEDIAPGLANIEMPGDCIDQNIVLFHSGWGDGVYPVIGEYDANDRLVAVHIDFMVVFDNDSATSQ